MLINIQFTLELEDANGYGLPFLDTVTSRRGPAIQVEVYRKPTHAVHYLDFLSQHPSCHKRSAVKTLLLRARNIPLASKGKRKEAQRVKAVLLENNYPSGFIKECERALATKPSQPTTNGFVVLPYVRGVSKRISCVLKQQSLRISFQPQRTINSLFSRPKQQDETDCPSSGIVYRINCILWPDRKSTEDADFWAQKGCSDVRPWFQTCVPCSWASSSYGWNVEVVRHEAHYHQRLFLEAWMSVKDPNAGNDHMVIPEVYTRLNSLESRAYSTQNVSIQKFLNRP